LIKKIARHPTDPVSKPPSSGPSAIETPNIAPRMPIACARSRGSVNVFAMIAIATGLSIAPPIAWTALNATNRPTVGATEHASDAVEKSARPTTSVRRRPSRSASEPASSSRLATTTVYASTVHCNAATPPPSSRPIAGRATFTAVASSPTISRLTEETTRTSDLADCDDFITVMKS
jgi:hypothetical protein